MWNSIKKYKVWILFAFYLNLFRLTVVVLILSLCLYLNFSKYSVYYAKHIPHDDGRDPEVEMLIKNIARAKTPEIDGLRYTKFCLAELGNCIEYTLNGVGEENNNPDIDWQINRQRGIGGYFYFDKNNSFGFTKDYKLYLYFDEQINKKILLISMKIN
ncbi:hypothetical protein K2V74_11935 [Mammaliicoccus sciuri]|uniref:hypothetical protein n=1 Tax=Mammaliicoccus sciuri TaxID=1296 RepID=UPI001E508AD9|nr:hypothetical protein [Mammaliicoccus sciuri]MCD8875035.1 hypothetical protein [Mammaliicoccus sciuri]